MFIPQDLKRFFGYAIGSFVILFLHIFLSDPLYGQVAGATLSGTIVDVSGTAIPGTNVIIKNTATEVTREVKTNGDGFYTAPNLLPGTYEISVSAQGFSTVVQRGITLVVGTPQVVNLTMRVGKVNEKIEVTAAVPTVELTSSTITGNIDPSTVRQLPLNGRDWTTLATLNAGVDTVPVQQPNQGFAPKGNRGYGNQMTISGTRPQQNNYRLDGISINDYSNGAPGSVVGLNLGVDTIAEFSVLTSNYSAEYGRTSGGVINAITRSGTNQFHGDLFEFLRNSALDARNFFDGPSVPPFRRNQFGGSAGGPILKDKMFIFGGYEGVRQSLTGTLPSNVPSLTARQGNLCAGAACSTFTSFPIETNGVGKYLAFWPVPQPSDPVCPPSGACAVGATGDTAIVSEQGKSTAREDFFTIRTDYKFSPEDSIYGTYLFDDAVTHAADPLNTWIAGNLSRRQLVALEETHIFRPEVANTLRFGFSRVSAIVNSGISPINPASNDNTLGIYSTHPQLAPQIFVGGLANAVGGVASDPTYHYHWNSYQLYDDAFWTRGLHSLKFGFAMERMQDNVLADSQPTGLIQFGSLQAFFSNQATSAIATIPGELTGRSIRQTLYGGYVQDDWRVRPNLTVNLGLRYEMTTVPTETNGKLSNLRTMTSPTIFLGSPYYNNSTLRNFDPRIGIAWDPFGDGKTSVRSAFGFFDVVPLPAAFALAISQSAPFYKFFTATSFPECAAGTFPTCIGDPNNNPSIVSNTTLQNAFIEFNPKRNYVMIWNLNIQREVAKDTSVMVGYIGNRGVHMLNREDDVNSVLPTQTAQGLLMPFNTPIPACTEATLNVVTGGSCRVNPNVGDVRGLYWTGDSFYDALEAEVRSRVGSRLTISGSYTFGKAIDTGSATVIGDPFQNSISSPYFFCKECRRGVSDFDIRHSFIAHLLWDIPSSKNMGHFGSLVLSGWQLGTIVTAQTGVPFTPIISGDILGLGSADPWAFPSVVNAPGCHSLVNSGNPSNYIKLNCLGLPLQGTIPDAECNMVTDPTTGSPACANLLGNVRRNSLPGPHLVSVDFSTLKNFPIKKISEQFNVQFRAEMFNLFNHANFAPPIVNAAVFQPTPTGASLIPNAGAIDRTTTTSRQIQFGLKVTW
jgi:outer membrane receptor protein involved in Fe transport